MTQLGYKPQGNVAEVPPFDPDDPKYYSGDIHVKTLARVLILLTLGSYVIMILPFHPETLATSNQVILTGLIISVFGMTAVFFERRFLIIIYMALFIAHSIIGCIVSFSELNRKYRIYDPHELPFFFVFFMTRVVFITFLIAYWKQIEFISDREKYHHVPFVSDLLNEDASPELNIC